MKARPRRRDPGPGVSPPSKAAWFPALCAAWACVMGLLAALGPLGRHPAAAMALYGAGFVLTLLMQRTFPQRLDPVRALLTIIALGSAGRLLFLLGFPPNTDIYRYIWEGAVQNHGVNPYAVAPLDVRLDPQALDPLEAVRERVNHPWIAAVYPPLALLVFRGLAAFSLSTLLFKLAFFLFDLGLLALLAAGIRRRGLDPSRLLLYAANPLAIVFGSGEGHCDVIQSFFLFLGWLLVDRGRTAAGAFGLGMAAMAKYLAAAAAPFLLRGAPGRWRRAAVFAPLLLFLPYLEAGGRLFGPLMTFGGAMHYNDALPALLRWVLGPAGPALGAAALGAIWVGIFLSEDDGLRAAYLAIGALLLFLPTLHPWYLLLIAPFLCFFPSPAWLYLQAAALFTFPVLGVEYRTGVFSEIPILKMPEYLPFFFLLIYTRLRPLSIAGGGAPRSDPGRVAVVIPALNEAESVGRCLASIRSEAGVVEVIVVDGGSTDATRRLAADLGARVVVCPPGRGRQIRAGVEAASAEVVLVLHADAVLRPGSVRRVLEALARHPEAVGGCLGMAFDDRRWRSRLIAALNNLRAIATGIAFGNQAQFFRAATLARHGGFPDRMLMEDVEASLRLKAIGPVIYLRRGVVVSGRRWRGRRFGGHFRQVLSLFLRYLVDRRLGRSRGRDEGYYREYYGGG